MKASILHPFQRMFNACVTARGAHLEEDLPMYNHQGTAAGFWMKADLKIHRTVSESLANKADNLVLYSKVFPSAWVECW